MKHVAAIVQREKVYSLEFTTTNVRREPKICFWEGKELVTMVIDHCGRDPVVRSCVLPCSHVLSAVSLEPIITCCAGGSADFIKTLNKVGLQYAFVLVPLQVENLMLKPSFSVMGKIDMFSMVRTLLVRLSGLLDESWTQSTKYFRKVR